MSNTLAGITLAVAKLVGDVKEGPATAGSATTVIDTAAYRPEAINYWDYGTIWMRTGLNAGKSRLITTWTLTTFTWLFPTMTELNAAGNLYSVCHKNFPRYVLIDGVNRALRELGPNLPASDTSLTTVAGQEEYSLPTGVHNVNTLEVAQSTASPYSYQPHYQWKEIAGKIRFDQDREPGSTGYKIRLNYTSLLQTELTADTDTLPDLMDADMIVWMAAVNVLRWRFGPRTEGQEPHIAQLLAEATARAEQAKGKWLRLVSEKTKPGVHLAGW